MASRECPVESAVSCRAVLSNARSVTCEPDMRRPAQLSLLITLGAVSSALLPESRIRSIQMEVRVILRLTLVNET